MREQAAAFFRELQERICGALEALDGSDARFVVDPWQRTGGGGGLTRVLHDGALFEKAGVNWSRVHGDLATDFAKSLPGEGTEFFASGISLVLHPRSPMVPTMHANFRYLEHGTAQWFGGGADLTPYYFFREDAVHFHRTWKTVCDRFRPDAYAKFKEECDRYFFLPHRGETRGVGGIFFDYLRDDLDRTFEFVRGAGDSILGAYVPIAARRRNEPWGDSERAWQLCRRGRYVEFNLLYDRGTLFGLKTSGRTESILMSLPPLVRWDYADAPAAGSREAELLAALHPCPWLD